MFNYKINFIRSAKNNYPGLLQNPESLNWIRALTKPVRSLYDEFQKLKNEYLYKIRFNGQACYLQAILNLKFDPILWRIHVTDAREAKNYIYRKTGSPLYKVNYIYRNWDSGFAYQTGQFAQSNHYVYVALAPNTGVVPGTAAAINTWRLHTRKHMVLRRKVNEGVVIRYVIWISSAVVYNATALTSTLDYYRFRGLKYIIKIF